MRMRVGVLVAVAAFAAAQPADADARPRIRFSADIVERLRAGQPLRDAGLTILGDIDLRGARVVNGVFRCRECRLRGNLLASDVVFKSAVDVSGLEIKGRVDFHGATFVGPVLFGSEFDPAGDGASFSGDADFSLTTFGDLVSFEDSTFDGHANFRLARFRSDSVFAGATFSDPADFTAAVFTGPTSFNGADFVADATLDGGFFGSDADFRQSVFERGASFTRTEFEENADFSQAEFEKEAVFSQARFGDGASFVGVRFSGEGEDPEAASFERVSSLKRLDFTDATFSQDADFRDVTTASMWFDHTVWASRATVYMRAPATGDLLFAVDDVDQLSVADREGVLRLIESSAKARGDIGLVNDAHYRLQVLASRDDWLLRRLADAVFYRGVAGYFVRPLRPLVALAVFALAVGLWREFVPAGRSGAQAERLERRPRRWLRRLGSLFVRLFDSVASIGRGKPDVERRTSIGSRLEVLVYRALVVCAMIGLANSNPTLRQMFEALL